ncbi:MAG: hypothetical protein ABGX16_08385, partial [Pirellulales bacterium]
MTRKYCLWETIVTGRIREELFKGLKTTAFRRWVRRQSAKARLSGCGLLTAIATKWRKHLAVGREPVVYTQVSCFGPNASHAVAKSHI